MKPMHVVHLLRGVNRLHDPWPSSYFPRKFYYRKDALELVKEVIRRGGDAVIRKEAKP